MYTYEQRLAAVKLYIKYGNRAAPEPMRSKLLLGIR